MGYTLAPAKAASSHDATVNSSETVLNTDDKEKLKALQDLKNDKVFEIFFNLNKCPTWNYNPSFKLEMA